MHVFIPFDWVLLVGSIWMRLTRTAIKAILLTFGSGRLGLRIFFFHHLFLTDKYFIYLYRGNFRQSPLRRRCDVNVNVSSTIRVGKQNNQVTFHWYIHLLHAVFISSFEHLFFFTIFTDIRYTISRYHCFH